MVHLSLLKEDPMLSPPTWSIQTLLPGLPPLSKKGPDPTAIAGITHNSQDVKPNYMFVAIRGFAVDGHTFIPDALARGATCIVLEDPARIPSDPSALFIQVPDTREALAILSANFYENPSKHLTLIGVTGTNGKTTLTYLLESILAKAGILPGVMGTINYRYLGKTFEAETTTPDSLTLQRTLKRMLSANVKVVVMEVSSHALALHRVDGCHFDIAVWTNLSQDHLDFHPDMEDYFQAKKSLFATHLQRSEKQKKTAVINLDDAFGKRLYQEIGALPRFTYGTTSAADIHSLQVHLDASGIVMSVQTPRGVLTIESILLGHHNQMNILAAIATAMALNIPPQAIIEGLKQVVVPGRLQPVENELGITVLVDYAHTPDALKNVLESLHHLAKKRIITVFGCGGDRDRGKRPKMGAIAERLSDAVILTDDNPRTEASRDILREIETGIGTLTPVPEEAFLKRTKGYIVVPDRREAIHLAIQSAAPGDIVLIAGKGHETYQVIGTEKISFSDVRVARDAISERQEQKG
jgi:UDP-N-acetylmuramyl-tripeptide synthetase